MANQLVASTTGATHITTRRNYINISMSPNEFNMAPGTVVVSEDEGGSSSSNINLSPSTVSSSRSSVPVNLSNNNDLMLPNKQPSLGPVTTSSLSSVTSVDSSSSSTPAMSATAAVITPDGKPYDGEGAAAADASASSAVGRGSDRRTSLGEAGAAASDRKSMMKKITPATVPGAVACTGDGGVGRKSRAYATSLRTASMNMDDLVEGTSEVQSSAVASAVTTSMLSPSSSGKERVGKPALVPGAVPVSAVEAAAYESSASASKKLSSVGGSSRRGLRGSSTLRQNSGGEEERRNSDDQQFPTLNRYVSENYDEDDGETTGSRPAAAAAVARRPVAGQTELEKEYAMSFAEKDVEKQLKLQLAGPGGFIAPGACSVGPGQPGVAGALSDRENLRFFKQESSKDLLVTNKDANLYPDHKDHNGAVNTEGGPIEATLVQDDQGPSEETLRQLEEIKRRERELEERERLLAARMSGTAHHPHAHGHHHAGPDVIIHATPVVADVVEDYSVSNHSNERSDYHSNDSSNMSSSKRKKNGLGRMFSRPSSRSESPQRNNLKSPPPGSIPTSIGGPALGLPKRSTSPARDPSQLAKFKSHEIRIGKTVHSDDRFATVVVDNILLDGINGGGGGADNDLRRQDLSGQVIFNTGKKKEHLYTVKFIQPSVMRDGMNPVASRAIQKLKGELSLLSRMRHENIVSIEGLSTIFHNDNEAEGYGATKKYHPTSYFFVMENCVSNGTLKERLANNWNKRRGMTSLLGGSKSTLKATFLERVQAMADLSSAISFLHSKNIMHCDITPDNIGFSFIPDSTSNGGNDNNTGLKLFNFGRAKMLRPMEGKEFQPYDLTLVTQQSMVGTLPYAAPEVGIKDEYLCGLAVDTYAFAIIMWEIMTLKTALDDFHQFLMEDTNDQCKISITPKLDSSVPQALHDLLNQCWHSNRQFRPRMDVVDTFLQQFEKQNRPMQFGLH